MRESNGVYSSKTKFRSMSMNNDVTSNMAGKSSFTVPTINPPTAHANCKKWVIFSDLHVKGASIDVCEEVLAQVHLEAQRRSAGIIFLGDFWHVRGALSVELLNRVLRALRKWEQPVIMIPGNHDQVKLFTNSCNELDKPLPLNCDWVCSGDAGRKSPLFRAPALCFPSGTDLNDQ